MLDASCLRLVMLTFARAEMMGPSVSPSRYHHSHESNIPFSISSCDICASFGQAVVTDMAGSIYGDFSHAIHIAISWHWLCDFHV